MLGLRKKYYFDKVIILMIIMLLMFNRMFYAIHFKLSPFFI